MITLTFSHDGWYGSSGRVQLLDDEFEVDDEHAGQARVRAVRELIDPWNWVRNFRAATDYLAVEPGVDPSRLGAWGTSFGAGTALYCASTDDRFGALVVQAGFMETPPEEMRAYARHRASEIARGEIAPFPFVDAFPGFTGALNVARMQHYDPVAAVDRLTAPTLIMDAAKEELFDIGKSGGRVHELLAQRGDIDVVYDVIPNIDHYAIYSEGFPHSSAAALDWYGRYLTHTRGE